MINPLDLCSQGDPETVALLATGTLIGLHIRGVTGNVTLGIREDRHGWPVSCAVLDAFGVETGWHSNPRRARRTRDGR